MLFGVGLAAIPTRVPVHAALPPCCGPQVLFFCPPMRDALMRHVPEPSAEFSLTCEMSLLFRMLATAASGTVCQVCCSEGAARWAGARPAAFAWEALPVCILSATFRCV